MKEKYLGIELGGSKGHRTSLVALDFFPEDGNKIFLHHLYSHLPQVSGKGADDQLIQMVNDSQAHAIGVNAPLTLPPCISCEVVPCPGAMLCSVHAVAWMREELTKVKKTPSPYTQRPVDILLRGKWQEEMAFIPADETLGAGRAPLAARIHYLKKHFRCEKIIEVYPRLALAGITKLYGLSEREVRRSRDVDEGVLHRFNILDKMSKGISGFPHLFLYDSDIQSLANDIYAFDALLCALMAIYDRVNLLEKSEFSDEWGRIAKPISIEALK